MSDKDSNAVGPVGLVWVLLIICAMVALMQFAAQVGWDACERKGCSSEICNPAICK